MNPAHVAKSALVFSLRILVWTLAASPLFAQEVKRPVQPVYLPALERPPVKVASEKLPKGATGFLPRTDGDTLHVALSSNISPKNAPSEQQVRLVLAQVLGATNWTRDLKELELAERTALPVAKAQVVDDAARRALQEDQTRVSGQTGSVSKKTRQAMEQRNREFRETAMRAQEVYVFEQRVGGVPIDNSGLRAIWQAGRGLVAVTGRVFDQVTLSNTKALTDVQAIAAAKQYLATSTQVQDQPAPVPVLVILPYGSQMRYAWRFEIQAKEGPYAVWVDSQTGNILQLLPRFFNDSAQGLVSNPAPTVGNTIIQKFQVDPPSGFSNYTLNLAGKESISNLGADGQGTSIVSMPSGGATSADFNIVPFNGNIVDRTSNAGYDTWFQQVNAFAWVYVNTTNFEGYGSRTFPRMTVIVNDSDACSSGLDNACESDDKVDFSIGSATGSTSTAASACFNAALDATVVTHEWGHKLTALQNAHSGGTIHSSMNEGLSDFWAATVFNNPVFGAWWCKNRTAPVQSGFAPRQADPLDAFPSHLNIGGTDANAEAHADGQIVDWALWQTQNGLKDISALGTLLIDTDLLKALTTAGVGITDGEKDKRVHDAYLDLLKQLTVQFGTNSNINKLLAGFAQAGIFLSQRDAVIDIDHDYLASGSAPPPTFTVWTGRNYTFDPSEKAVLNQSVFNTQYTIELANDANFTVHHINSGILTALPNSTAGVPTATWSPAVSDWNTLSTGTSLFYRVTTTDSNGANSCVSTSPGCGSIASVNVPFATINQTGTGGQCTALPNAPSGRNPWPILFVLLAAFAIRCMLRKRIVSDAT